MLQPICLNFSDEVKFLSSVANVIIFFDAITPSIGVISVKITMKYGAN
jgi:hypothetical protein